MDTANGIFIILEVIVDGFVATKTPSFAFLELKQPEKGNVK